MEEHLLVVKMAERFGVPWFAGISLSIISFITLTKDTFLNDFLVKLIAGDQIVFQFIAEDEDVVISTHGTFGDFPESASVVIKKIANLP